MKRILISALICGMMFAGCASEKGEPLQYVKTELGGCNLVSNLKSDVGLEEKSDTLIITVSKESVRVFVGLNYICKDEPFKTRCEIIDNAIVMYISDVGGDYYRCRCYYTFDFIFKWQGKLNHEYKIVLNDRWKGVDVIISEGIITN